MDNLEARFDAFGPTFEVLELVGLFFLVLIVSETTWDLISRRRASIRESLANFAIAVGNHLLDRTVYGLVFIFGLFLADAFSPLSIPMTWWSWILAVIVADFTYYWMHRFEHEVRVLWAYHSVHHSSPEYNLTTSLRLAWVEGLIEWLFFVPMIMIGFDVVQTIVALSIVVAYQTWIHTEKIGKMGWADRVFNTPSVHRVHHASNQVYLDKNYGGILILWDRLFGTYKAEDEDVVFGITKPIESSNPIVINFHEFAQIWRDLRASKSVSEAWGYLFYRPGWRPRADRPPAE